MTESIDTPSFTDNDVVTRGRYAGLVKRYHTWPMLREQTVAEHTWQMMRIYHEIWGPLSPDIVTVMLYHDCGELSAGDIPLYAKRDFPPLKEAMDKAEEAGLQRLSIDLPDLDLSSRWRVKMCDLLEGIEHCCVEYAMGNKLMIPAIQNYGNAIDIYLRKGEDAEEDLEAILKWLGAMDEHYNNLSLEAES